jgi:RNA polymerase sigma-70 factor, ECF subfamily
LVLRYDLAYVFDAGNAAMTDEALMAAYQKGDLQAFSLLVERHERPLWNFLRRFVNDVTLAEDLLQETFMRVVKSAASWKAQAKFTTWLYTIARNLCIDQQRRNALRRTTSLDVAARGADADRDSAPALGERIAGSDRGGEAAAITQQLAAEIDAAIAALPTSQREVFLMREVLGLPFAEIATALGENVATVKSRMRYALTHLRDALAQNEPSGGEAA